MSLQDKRQELFEAARKLFLDNGFKKTSVSEITSMAQVAVGTFYKYYDSKEQIFCEVYLAENERSKRIIVDQVDTRQPPKAVVKEFLSAVIQTSSQNNILTEWYRNSELNQMITRKYAHNNKHNDFIYNFLIDQIKLWRESGQFREDLSEETMIALFNSLIVIDLHKEEVGSEHFPEILELLAGFLVDGLSK